MTYEKLDNFDFKLRLGEQTHSLAYRIAPNVVIARNPCEGAKSNDWQLICEHSGGRIQGGLRTRAGALEAWQVICEYSDLDPTAGLPRDDGKAAALITEGIKYIRGIGPGRTKHADLDWMFAA